MLPVPVPVLGKSSHTLCICTATTTTSTSTRDRAPAMSYGAHKLRAWVCTLHVRLYTNRQVGSWPRGFPRGPTPPPPFLFLSISISKSKLAYTQHTTWSKIKATLTSHRLILKVMTFVVIWLPEPPLFMIDADEKTICSRQKSCFLNLFSLCMH